MISMGVLTAMDWIVLALVVFTGFAVYCFGKDRP